MTTPGIGCETAHKITVCLSADKRFALPLAVTLSSLAAHHEKGSWEAIVFAENFDDKTRVNVQGAVGDSLPITWYEMKDIDLSGVQLRYPSILSKATCFRLLLPSLLPSTIDRLIYLDCDTVVCGPLFDLWSMELSGEMLVAAVYDGYVPWAGAPGGTAWRDLHLAPSTPYFNAGVMLVPLGIWRDRDIGSQALDLMKDKELIYADQCALNGVIQGSWQSLHPKWNVQTPHLHGWHFGWVLYGDRVMQEALDCPAIVHYSSGRSKPWENMKHPMANRWYQVIDQTSWNGWRPGGADRGLPI